MDIKQLNYFLTVARAETYSLAASRLSVSQPALSISIKNLEEELGVKLFYTFGRRQMLTDEGKRLKEKAQKLLDMYQETLEDVKSADSKSSGTITVGIPPIVATIYLSELIVDFNKVYPNVKINLVEDGSQKLDEMLLNGEIDIACTLKTVRTVDFEYLPFTKRQNVAILNKNHRLADRKSITLAELREEPFAIFNDNFILHHQIIAGCHKAGFYPKIAILTSQWDFMVEIAAHNRGVAILPSPIMEKYPNPDVRCIPFVDDMKHWEIILAWNKKRYLSKACRLFLRHIINNRDETKDSVKLPEILQGDL